MPRPRLSSSLRAALSIGVLLLVVATALAHRQAASLRDGFPAEDDLVYLPRTSVLKAVSLGHPEAMADLVFLRTVTYFGTQLSGGHKYDWFQRHLDTVVELDPYFRTAYVFGGSAAMYNGKTIENDDVKLSTHFLEAGLRAFPSDWELAFMIGCNYLFELKTTDPAERDRWRLTGAEYIRRAAISGQGPPWLASLAATIMSSEGETEAALRYLEEAYLTAADDRTRDEIGHLLAAKRRDASATFTAARERFDAAWKRTLPYAPADLYVLVGEPRPARMDWRALMAETAIDKVLRDDRDGAAATPSSDGARP